MHCTCPRSPSRSARLAITCKLVTQDEAVRPVLVVDVEFGLGGFRIDAVESRGDRSPAAIASSASRFSLGTARQVIDDRLGMNFLLDVERRRVHHEVGPVLLA